MATAGEPLSVTGDAPVVRPDVLAYPSPTTTRFLVLVAALLTAGLFVGTWVHNGSAAGDAWLRAVATCSVQSASPEIVDDLETVLSAQEAYADCIAPAERTRAGFALGGALIAAIGGAVLLFVAPLVVERRRRLRVPGPRLDSATRRFRELAADARLPRPPELVVGPATLRDAFSYGAPGHYRVALPPAIAVRWKDVSRFDPVVRHELAHVAHHDIALAWLTRAIWYALIPLLVLPVLLAAARADFSVVPDYLWRAALLGAVVLLVSTATLRSREHDADLRAARLAGDERGLTAVLRSARPLPGAGWRHLLAYHPQPDRRVQVLDRPAEAARVTVVDGFAAAYLAALSSPLLVGVISTLLTGTGRADLAEVAADLLVGPLIGATVGLGLWRQILVGRLVGAPRANVSPVALGVGVGLILGQVVSLGNAGVGIFGGLDNPVWLLVTGVLASGATVVMAGLGELWADAAPRIRSARGSWIPAVALGGVLFAAVLWAAATLQKALDFGGWTFAGAVLITVLGTAPPAVAALILAAGAGWALIRAARAPSLAPPWLLETGSPPVWPTAAVQIRRATVATGVPAGVAGAATVVLYRAGAGAAVDFAAQEARFYAYLWVAALVGSVAALVLAIALPERGPGAALVAAPLASLISISGFVALNTVLGGALISAFVADVVQRPLGLGLLLCVLVAAIAIAPSRPSESLARPILVLVPTALLCAVAASSIAIAVRASLIPSTSAATEASSASAYVSTVAPQIARQYTEIEDASRSIITSSGDADTIARRMRSDVVAPLDVLAREATSLSIDDAAARGVHQEAIAALELAIEAFTAVADAHEHGDPELLEHAVRLRAEEGEHWQQWQAGVEQLDPA